MCIGLGRAALDARVVHARARAQTVHPLPVVDPRKRSKRTPSAATTMIKPAAKWQQLSALRFRDDAVGHDCSCFAEVQARVFLVVRCFSLLLSLDAFMFDNVFGLSSGSYITLNARRIFEALMLGAPAA